MILLVCNQNSLNIINKIMDTQNKVVKTNEEWKEVLDPETYHVTREKGTELPFTGEYDSTFENGMYKCSNCGTELFSSTTKFDAGCGWPSFYAPINNENVETIRDTTHGMIRDEVVCKICGAHLGHVFEDAPEQLGGLRYCINSLSLKFDKKSDDKSK
jgi:peptide-methionine (R)-S-oxide reductase